MAQAEDALTARRFFLLLPALGLVGIFLVLPLVFLGRTSFYDSTRPWETHGWSLRHYEAFFGDGFYLSVLGETIAYGVIVAIGTAIVAFPVAYSLARAGPSSRRWLLAIVVLPLTLSLVVNVFGWMVILGRSGPVNQVLLTLGIVDRPIQLLFSRGTVLLVLGHTFLPFQILSIMTVISQIDPVVEEAAASLRANRWSTLTRVVVPLAWPGILAGSTIVFMLTISAFITPRLLGGASVQMLGSLIYEQVMVVLNWPFGAALSLVLLAIALAVAALAGRTERRGPSRKGSA